MAWARYDDELSMNKKVSRLRTKGKDGIAAIGLHLLANTWSRNQGTGGYIERHIPGQLVGNDRLGIHLAGLLEWAEMFDVADGGWELHNFDEFSDPKDDGRPAAVKKRERREIARVNGSKGGLAKASKTSSKTVAVLEQNSTPVPVPVPDVSTQENNSHQQTPNPPTDEDDPLVVRLKKVCHRYAEIRWAQCDQGEIRSQRNFQNSEYAKALEMKDAARLVREYPDAPVDVLANALNGEKSSLRYFQAAS